MTVVSSFGNSWFRCGLCQGLLRAAAVGLLTAALVACFNEDNESGQESPGASADLSPPLHPSYGRETARRSVSGASAVAMPLSQSISVP